MGYDDYLEIEDDGEFFAKTGRQIFAETFAEYFELLKNRIDRLKTFDVGTLDHKTFLDMCLVQIRALCVENDRLSHNYTVQNFLSTNNCNDLANEFNQYLNQNINKLYTLREALKTVVDKFIVHYDTIALGENEDTEYEYKSRERFIQFLFEKDLLQKDYPFNIYIIFKKINDTLNQSGLLVPNEKNK